MRAAVEVLSIKIREEIEAFTARSRRQEASLALMRYAQPHDHQDCSSLTDINPD